MTAVCTQHRPRIAHRHRWHETIRRAVPDDPALDVHALAVAGALHLHMSDDGVCWPGQRTIARYAAVAPNTVIARVEALVAAGWLDVETRPRSSSIYRATIPEWAEHLVADEPAASPVRPTASPRTATASPRETEPHEPLEPSSSSSSSEEPAAVIDLRDDDDREQSEDPRVAEAIAVLAQRDLTDRRSVPGLPRVRSVDRWLRRARADRRTEHGHELARLAAEHPDATGPELADLLERPGTTPAGDDALAGLWNAGSGIPRQAILGIATPDPGLHHTEPTVAAARVRAEAGTAQVRALRSEPPPDRQRNLAAIHAIRTSLGGPR